MSRVTLLMPAFAKRLILHDLGRNGSAATKLPGAFSVPAKLRSPLVKLIGSGGFRALLLRSLALAGAEVPWLRAVRVKPDGALEGFEEIQPQPPPEDFLEGSEVLLAQLLGLLVTFIGPALTSRLVGEIWPKFSLKDLDLDKGDKK
jgi:hypothetical protein